MSLFSWLFPAPKKRAAKSQPDSSGLSRMDATMPVRPGMKTAAASNGQPANRKGERMARRELLYLVVRDAMMRAGVLSASYKFKVLSLDARGRQFLVMVDLARDFGGDTGRLAEIEAMIAQGAKSRHDILVTAVYWRMNEHVAVGDPRLASAKSAGAAGPVSEPAALESQPATLDSAPMPLAARPADGQRFDPIQADEVAAFKKALAAGIANPAAVATASTAPSQGASARGFDGAAKHGPQSYTLLTGFEDTEMAEGEGRQPVLSGTQYGELR